MRVLFFPLSGFSYYYIQENKANTEVYVNEEWGPSKSPNTNKTNTVLQYDEHNKKVIKWGASALSSEPKRRGNNNLSRPVEYFKFYLSDSAKSKKPKLPDGITFEKAITDYLREMGNNN